MTLQKVREGILRAWLDSYRDLRDQLADERKETEAWKQNGLNAVAGLERQLAAEREKTKQWRDKYAALHEELIEERRLHDERTGMVVAR